VRGTGHWHAVDFTSDRKTKAPFADDTIKEIVDRMRKLGVMVSANGVSAIEMAPPLIVTRADLDNAVEVCARAVHEVADRRNLP
jgi:putrescine---pyruvate transaminase